MGNLGKDFYTRKNTPVMLASTATAEARIAGGISVGDIINIIGMAIQQRISVTELETLQMATHPYLTSAPTMYPVVLSAQNALGKM